MVPSFATTLISNVTLSPCFAVISLISTLVSVGTTYNTIVSSFKVALMYFNPSGTAYSVVNSPFSNTPSISPVVVVIVTGTATLIGLANVPFTVPVV